jgi:ribonuclease P protein component
MLPQKNRLHLQRDIERVQKTGRATRGELFSLRFSSGQSEVSRFCFIVSKKVSKKAVERNRVVRWARESVGGLLPALIGVYDVIIYAQRGVSFYSFQLCEKEILSLLQRANILRPRP